MTALLELLLWGATAAVAVPCFVLAVECIAAMLPRRTRRAAGDVTGAGRPRCAVLVPAHDEEPGIAATVRALRAQLAAHDRLLVIADNCSDRTAEVARDAGAFVVERRDETRRGKGYALAAAVDALRADPPEVAIVMDADMEPGPGAIDAIAAQAAATGRPAQAIDLLAPPPDAGANDLLSSLAFTVRNAARPTGLARLGLPSQLAGTGMALPWTAIRDAPLASGHLVEDMQLGVELAVAGYPASLCEDAMVSGRLAAPGETARAQRTRWEHGSLQLLLSESPRLVRESWRQRRLDLAALALDLCVPPLSLLALLLVALAAAATVATVWLGASASVLWLVDAAASAAIIGVLAAWWRFARDVIPLGALLRAPFYVIWKAPVYLAFALRRQRSWIRTPRS